MEQEEQTDRESKGEEGEIMENRETGEQGYTEETWQKQEEWNEQEEQGKQELLAIHLWNRRTGGT